MVEKQWPYPGLERITLSLLGQKVTHGAMDDAIAVANVLQIFAQ